MTEATLPSDRTMSASTGHRVDLDVVLELIEPGAKVLDVGCGTGELLVRLRKEKGIDARGIEKAQADVTRCVARGLSVVQGDADTDLAQYPDDAFDYVVLSQTLQATRAPRDVLEQLLRIGKRVVVSVPNFGHWRIRLQILFGGRMPVTENLPYSWYDTPNIHFCTLRDFVEMSDRVGARLERAVALNASGSRMSVALPWALWNLLGEQAVFVLSK